MSPARGNDEKHASASERNPCHNCSRRPHLEGRDLSGDEPDTGKQDQQVADLGECDARLMAERKHGSDSSYFDRPIPPVAERDLLNSQDYPSRAVAPRRTGFSGQGVRGEAHQRYPCNRRWASGSDEHRLDPSPEVRLTTGRG